MEPIWILYVGDDPLDRELVRDALAVEHGEFELVLAATREELEAALARAPFDLVLTDLHIAGFDGLQVIDTAHARQPGLPVVVFTATGSEERAAEAMKRGAADYVIKSPVHLRRLPGAIHDVLDRRRREELLDRARQQIEATNENLLRMLEDSQDAILVCDDRDLIRFANRAARELFGPRLVIGEELGMIPGEGQAMELDVPRADGTVAVVELRVGRTTWDGRGGRVATFRDVSVRVAAQRRIEELNLILRAVRNVNQLKPAHHQGAGPRAPARALLRAARRGRRLQHGLGREAGKGRERAAPGHRRRAGGRARRAPGALRRRPGPTVPGPGAGRARPRGRGRAGRRPLRSLPGPVPRPRERRLRGSAAPRERRAGRPVLRVAPGPVVERREARPVRRGRGRRGLCPALHRPGARTRPGLRDA